MNGTLKDAPAPKTWSETGGIAWVCSNPGEPAWLGREWRCIETGETKWEPVETIVRPLPQPPEH